MLSASHAKSFAHKFQQESEVKVVTKKEEEQNDTNQKQSTPEKKRQQHAMTCDIIKIKTHRTRMSLSKPETELKSQLHHGRDFVMELALLFAQCHVKLEKEHEGPKKRSHCLPVCRACTVTKSWKTKKSNMERTRTSIVQTLLNTATFFGFSLKEAVRKKMHVNEMKCPTHLVQVSVSEIMNCNIAHLSCNACSFQQTIRATCMSNALLVRQASQRRTDKACGETA